MTVSQDLSEIFRLFNTVGSSLEGPCQQLSNLVGYPGRGIYVIEPPTWIVLGSWGHQATLLCFAGKSRGTTAPKCANLRARPELMSTDGLFASALWHVVQMQSWCARNIAIWRVEWRVSGDGGSDSCSKTRQRGSLSPSYLQIGLLFSATFLHEFDLDC